MVFPSTTRGPIIKDGRLPSLDEAVDRGRQHLLYPAAAGPFLSGPFLRLLAGPSWALRFLFLFSRHRYGIVITTPSPFFPSGDSHGRIEPKLTGYVPFF